MVWGKVTWKQIVSSKLKFDIPLSLYTYNLCSSTKESIYRIYNNEQQELIDW